MTPWSRHYCSPLIYRLRKCSLQINQLSNLRTQISLFANMGISILKTTVIFWIESYSIFFFQFCLRKKQRERGNRVLIEFTSPRIFKLNRRSKESWLFHRGSKLWGNNPRESSQGNVIVQNCSGILKCLEQNPKFQNSLGLSCLMFVPEHTGVSCEWDSEVGKMLFSMWEPGGSRGLP